MQCWFLHRSASVQFVASLHRSDCFRLERQLPGGIRTRWDTAPFHGARQVPVTADLDQWLAEHGITTRRPAAGAPPTTRIHQGTDVGGIGCGGLKALLSCHAISIIRALRYWTPDSTCTFWQMSAWKRFTRVPES